MPIRKYVQIDRFDEPTILALEELLKTGDHKIDNRLHSALHTAFSSNRRSLMANPFDVPKTVGKRTIWPAGETLGFIQWVATQWMRRTFPASQDSSRMSNSVLRAVKAHQDSKYAFMVDLKSAYDHVTRERLIRAMQQYLPNVPYEVINALCYLLTYPVHGIDITPQGCVSTPDAYNLALLKAEKAVAAVCKKGLFRPRLVYTRYVDDVMISSNKPIDVVELRKQLGGIFGGAGFELGRETYFKQLPFLYLGTEIHGDHLSLDPNREGKFIDRVLEAREGNYPAESRKKVTGIFSWVHHVCGKEVPTALLNAIWSYFQLVGRPPHALKNIWREKHTYRLF